MWTAKQEIIEENKVIKYKLFDDKRQLTYSEVIRRWKNEEDFRTFFIETLKQNTFSAYFWETPAITLKTINQPFEFVLVQSRILSNIKANPTAFLSYFGMVSEYKDVVSFLNLGKDATLIVPAVLDRNTQYPHLAAFLNTAPIEQQHAFWQSVGAAMEKRINKNRIWLSTAGLGVSWLHVRLDNRPKYYRYQAYK